MTEPAKNIEIDHIIEAAHRLGVEMHEAEAIQWLDAIVAAKNAGGQMTVDEQTGVYGFNVTMLDFDAGDLERYRRIGAIVGIPGEEGVETALSLSGSAAQSRVQLYPGDCDFFERVNIAAPTREAACRKAGEVMRRKVLAKLRGPNYQFVEGKLAASRPTSSSMARRTRKAPRSAGAPSMPWPGRSSASPPTVSR